MISPEYDFQPEEFEVIADKDQQPIKLKNDSELSFRERSAKLSEWLYQQYLAYQKTVLVEVQRLFSTCSPNK